LLSAQRTDVRGRVSAGGYHEGCGTWYDAIGMPISACGVPAEEYKDESGKTLPFGALNTNSMFENGKNCGRWVEVTVGKNCVGSSNSQWSACDGGSALLLASMF
jgi:hypothetical protein